MLHKNFYEFLLWDDFISTMFTLSYNFAYKSLIYWLVLKLYFTYVETVAKKMSKSFLSLHKYGLFLKFVSYIAIFYGNGKFQNGKLQIIEMYSFWVMIKRVKISDLIFHHFWKNSWNNYSIILHTHFMLIKYCPF